MEILKKFDVFGIPITFRISGNEKYHSSISISCSLIIIIITIIFTYFRGLDFIFHSESRILQSKRTSKTYGFYNLTMENLFFAWRIEGVYGEDMNFTNILYPYIGYYSYKTEKELKINYDRCKNFNLSFNIPKDINNFYCSDLSNYSIGGGWENENKIEYFYLNIDICKNTSCPSKTDFFKLLSLYGGLYLIIYYPTISFIPEETIPYQVSYNKLNIFLDAQLINVNRFYIHKYIFEDDEGWIFQNVKNYNLFGISEIETYNFINDFNGNKQIPLNSYIYTGNFYIDKKYSYHKRWFSKAFESLALINGFYKSLFMIFGFFSSVCNRFILFQIIMEKCNDNYKPYSNPKLKLFHSDKDLSNIANNNDINSRFEVSNMNFKLNNNIIKSTFNIKKSGEVQPGSFSNKDGDLVSFVKQIKVERENRKEIPKININNKPIVYKGKNTQKVSYYSLLLFDIFHCCLSNEKKILYNTNNMNKNTFLKKFDIERYLDLFKKVDSLLNTQFQKVKSSRDNLVCPLNLLSNHI